MITKADLGYQLFKSTQVNGILDYNRTNGYGTGFGNHVREISSASLLVKQDFSAYWKNEFGIRKEFTNNYESPVLFSLGSSYQFNKLYNLKLNVSRNFRIPTFNDLYWETGGNPDLKPESSYQAEIGNVFTFKDISLTQTFYYIKIKDLALKDKQITAIGKWFDEKIKETYIKIIGEYRDCSFTNNWLKK